MVQNNFYSVVKPLMILCKLFGMLPYSYLDNKVVLFKYSAVYNTALLILSTWLAFEMSRFVLQENVIEAITSVIIVTINELQLLVAFAKIILNKQSWMSLAQAFQKTDSLFSEAGLKLPDEQLRRRMFTSFAYRYISMFLGFAINVYLKKIEAYIEYVYYFTLISFSSAFLCCIGVQVTRVRDGFQMLNKLLKERVDSDGDSVFKLPLRNLLSSTCIIHHSLTKIIKKINECYGIILLVTMTASFLMMVIDAHNVYLTLQTQDMIATVTDLIACCIFASNVLYLCHLCEETIEEVNYSQISVTLFILSYF